MDNKVYTITEKYELEENDTGVFITGLALPLNKTSRNKVYYTSESVKRTHQTLKGKPLLFNHDENKVIGHVEEVWLRDTGLYYKASLDPHEKDIIRKLKRGDINKVSIQAIVENMIPHKEFVKVDVKEFLELSVVTIAGFEDTSVSMVEKLLKEDAKNKRYFDEDGSFKKMSCPDDPNGKESEFCGCVRYFMSVKGLSLESAKKLCAYIKRKKGEKLDSRVLNELSCFVKEVYDLKVKEQEGAENEEVKQPDEEIRSLLKDLRGSISELEAKFSDLEARVKQLEQKQVRLINEEDEDVENDEDEGETKEEKVKKRKTCEMYYPQKPTVLRTSELLKILRGEKR